MTDHGEHGLSNKEIDALVSGARKAAAHAYVPYSSFPVGSCVLTADGTMIPGVNVENASYGLTVCGERVAVFRAAAEGHREIRAVAVSASRAPGTTPCGACRQVLNEFKPDGEDMVVVVDHGENGDPECMLLADLLPSAFGPKDLPEPS